MDFSIEPEMMEIPLFGGIEVSETLVSAVLASFLIIIFAAIVRIFFIPKFKIIPSRFQLLLEMSVDAIYSYTSSKVGQWASKTLSPYMFTVALIIIVNGIFELFGMRAAMTDINFTLALSLITFVLIQVYSIKKKGILKRLKSVFEPVFLLAPINIVTSIAVPVSLSCRMFGNILGGMIVMELLYSVAILKWAIPGVLAIYFTVFHTLMQAFIFITLSLTFINEGLE
ncbi:MAG: F0F1 ATP synthase subunit A [Clostridia bacterium]|nr:F0F1 ATP synthase subunit A [Clostridia bacterium]